MILEEGKPFDKCGLNFLLGWFFLNLLIFSTEFLIWVVDAANEVRMEESKYWLHEVSRTIISESEETSVELKKILIFANKTDLPSAYDVCFIAERLELNVGMC